MSETLRGDRDLDLLDELCVLSLPRFSGFLLSRRVSSIAASNGSKSIFLCFGDTASLKIFALIEDLGDFGDLGETVSPSSANCSRGGGLRGLILPSSKIMSAESEVLCNCPPKSNSKSFSFLFFFPSVLCFVLGVPGFSSQLNGIVDGGEAEEVLSWRKKEEAPVGLVGALWKKLPNL